METLSYLLKVSVCMALFFAIYLLVLRRLTFFRTNRFYLLSSLGLSFVIPALQFTIERIIEPVQNASYAVLFQDSSTPEDTATAQLRLKLEPVVLTKSFDWYSLLPYLYGVGVLILLSFTAWKLYQLLKHTRIKPVKVNGLKLVPKNVGFTNCSFFNYVFIDQQSLTANELQVLLRHEEVHAKQYHSLDKMIMMVVKAVLWFNPLVYWYDKALEEVHEYEADETTSANFGTAPYANLLLKLAVSKSNTPLIHNFVKSPIKERIKMLFHHKSKQQNKWSYLLILPLCLGLGWCFTVEVVYASPKIDKFYTVNQPKTVTKRSQDFLVPKVIEMKGAFLESNGEVNHLYYAKVQLFDGILVAKEVESELNRSLTAHQATFTSKDGVVVHARKIVFDLKKGTYTINNEEKPNHQDSLKRNRPWLIKSASMQVDTKKQISYIKKGEMEIFDMMLVAEDITYDQLNGVVTAKTAALKSKDGKKDINGETIVFNLGDGTYTVSKSKGEVDTDKATILQEFRDKLQYAASDSIRTNNVSMMLYGDAKVKLDDIVLKGEKIEIDAKKNSIIVYKGSMSEAKKIILNADRIDYNFLTKKGVVTGHYLSFDECNQKH